MHVVEVPRRTRAEPAQPADHRTLPGATYAAGTRLPRPRRPARPRRAARGRRPAPASRRRPRGRPRPRRRGRPGPDPAGQPDRPAVEPGDQHPVPARRHGRELRGHPRREQGQAGAEAVVRRGDGQPGEDAVDRVGVAGLERADEQAGAGHARTVLGPPVTDLSVLLSGPRAGSPASDRRRRRPGRRPSARAQRVEDGLGDLLAGGEHGDAGWVRRHQLDADPADGVGGDGRSPAARSTRRGAASGRPARRRTPATPTRARLAPTPADREQEGVDQRAEGRGGVGQRPTATRRSRSAASTGRPAASRSCSTAMPSAPVPVRRRMSLSGSTSGPVEHDQPVDGGQPLARRRARRRSRRRAAPRRRARGGPAPRRCWPGSRPPGWWSRWPPRRRRGGPGRCRSVRARSQRRLAPRRQRLVRADDQRVGAELERVPRQVGVEAEVRRPGGVDDERDVVLVGRGREAGDVADRADVRRVAHEHGPRVGVPVERAGDGRRRDAERQPAGRVDLGPYPDRGRARRAPGRAASSGAGSGSPPPGRRRRRGPGRRPGWRASPRRPRTGRRPRPTAAPPGPRRRPARRASASWCPGRRTAGRRRRPRRRPGRGAACAPGS